VPPEVEPPVLPPVLLAALIVLGLLLLRPAPAPLPEERPAPASPRYLLSACLIAAAFILFSSFYNGYIHHLQILSGYTEYNVYSWPRLMLIPCYLLFAALGDVRQGRLVPPVSLCIALAAMLNSVLNENQTTTVLLETMAGKGSEVGSRFEELRAIIDRVELSSHIGVCLDTCHVWDGGYDIVGDLDGVVNEFDRIVGIDRLKAIHLNDSLNNRGAHKDRHARIGEGHIGFEALCRVINHPALRELPFILETPNDEAGYAREIAMLKEAYKN